MSITQRYAGYLERGATNAATPVKAEAMRQAANKMRELERENVRLRADAARLVTTEGVMTDVVLENAAGVQILKSKKFNGHYGAANALCHCGEELIVAPPIFHPDHKKGDPVMVCGDHGVHGFRFLDLVQGRQLMPNAKLTGRAEGEGPR